MRTIAEDILGWSKNYIEKPSEALGNVPVCPYAKKARETKALKILEVTDHTKLIDNIVEGTELIKNPDIDIVIVGCDDVQITIEELSATIHAYNLSLIHI